jgi:hypothetical protein
VSRKPRRCGERGWATSYRSLQFEFEEKVRGASPRSPRCPHLGVAKVGREDSTTQRGLEESVNEEAGRPGRRLGVLTDADGDLAFRFSVVCAIYSLF